MSEHHEHHLMSFKTHINVFVALIVLTVVTVLLSSKFGLVDFGKAGLLVALLIATAKAAIVMGWFMHLKYDGMMNRVIFLSSFFFLVLFIFFCLLDILTRINPRL
tara:strand:- start:5396 stop:5710 length:315 start_codon:yes stop_codon:yes gene_type:complete